MSNQSSAIVQRLWNTFTVQRGDGRSYGDLVGAVCEPRHHQAVGREA
ncbi:MAG: hypothetical protein ACK2U5_16780 [Candidatus Promineifilaceae bacterium]